MTSLLIVPFFLAAIAYMYKIFFAVPCRYVNVVVTLFVVGIYSKGREEVE